MTLHTFYHKFYINNVCGFKNSTLLKNKPVPIKMKKLGPLAVTICCPGVSIWKRHL